MNPVLSQFRVAGPIVPPRPVVESVPKSICDAYSPGEATPLNKLSTAELCAETVTLKLDETGKPKTVTGDDFGDSSPVFCTLADGRPGVLKLERPKSMCELKQLEAWWAHQVISSDIMDRLGCHSVHYREAHANYNGEVLRGTACELVEEMQELAGNENLLQGLQDPDRAILGTVVCAWMGDFDRSIKNENIWFDKNKEVIYGDYGCAGLEQINAFGVMPKVNRKLFASAATPENVAAALEKIRGLSNRAIHDMVRQGARLIPTVTREVLQEMTATLIKNRDQLRQDKSWGLDLIGPAQTDSYAMPEKIAAAFLDRIREKYGDDPNRSSAEIARLALENVPGYGPDKGKDINLVSLQLSNALTRRGENGQAKIELLPDCFYAWMQLAKKIFTVDESLALGLGLKHRGL
ncbi:MAG: hypothetical protein KF760_13340 [Candidatus Eremiobacteraeota bacterium]|nr:hypothetical protein [Candidatus Eremiobacteraeota bacterium]MCW5872716.1 hypothetical protein [Candidatus Eremiobacteraeota bacterium]